MVLFQKQGKTAKRTKEKRGVSETKKRSKQKKKKNRKKKREESEDGDISKGKKNRKEGKNKLTAKSVEKKTKVEKGIEEYLQIVLGLNNAGKTKENFSGKSEISFSY